MAELAFIHRFVKGSRPMTVLALHGTGGDEDDLVPLAQMVAPGANVLSPRGRVLENGMPRFFRRLAEGVFDEEDLAAQAQALAEFVRQAARHYDFDARQVVALGFSNGANIASALMFLHPEVLAHAALLRPMIPLTRSELPDLSGKRVLLASGRRDPLIPVANAEALADMYRRAGAEVQHAWGPASHGLIQDDLRVSKAWFETLPLTPNAA
jgi:phospholipase/carboxylesterase